MDSTFQNQLNGYIHSQQCQRQFENWLSRTDDTCAIRGAPKLRFYQDAKPVVVMAAQDENRGVLMVKTAFYTGDILSGHQLYASASIHLMYDRKRVDVDLSTLTIWRTAKLATHCLLQVTRHGILSIGILGCGAVGRELVRQLAAGAADRYDLHLFDRHMERAANLAQSTQGAFFRVQVASLSEILNKCQYIITAAGHNSLQQVPKASPVNAVIVLDYTVGFLFGRESEWEVYADDASQLPTDALTALHGRVGHLTSAQLTTRHTRCCFIITGEAALDLYLIMPLVEQLQARRAV